MSLISHKLWVCNDDITWHTWHEVCLLGVVVIQSLCTTEVEHLVRALASISPHVEDMYALLSYQMPTRKKCHCKPKMCMRERKTARANHRKWQAGFVESCPEIVLKHTADLAEQNESIEWNGLINYDRKKDKSAVTSDNPSKSSLYIYPTCLFSLCSFQSFCLRTNLTKNLTCHNLLAVMLFQIYVIDFGSILEESFACFSI